MTTPSAVTAFITSPGLRRLRRTVASVGRHLTFKQPTVHFFHQVDDPYSHLLLLALPTVLARYDISLAMHLIVPPIDAAAPDRERLNSWSRRDADELSQGAVLPAPTCGLFARPPVPAAIAAAQEAMAALLTTELPTAERLVIALAISHECWRGDLPALVQRTGASRVQTDAILQSGDALLAPPRHRTPNPDTPWR